MVFRNASETAGMVLVEGAPVSAPPVHPARNVSNAGLKASVQANAAASSGRTNVFIMI